MPKRKSVTIEKLIVLPLREYIIIGEVIAQVIDLLEEEKPDYPWRMVKDFRNFIVHEYFGVDAKIVWDLRKLELDTLLHCIQTPNP